MFCLINIYVFLMLNSIISNYENFEIQHYTVKNRQFFSRQYACFAICHAHKSNPTKFNDVPLLWINLAVFEFFILNSLNNQGLRVA